MKSAVTLHVEAPAPTIALFRRIEDDVAAANTAAITYATIEAGDARFVVTPREDAPEPRA
jgi:hypothetical protein